MGEFKEVARTNDIPVGEMRDFEFGPHRFVVAHTEDGFYAVADECTHDSAPIADGEIDGCDVVCMRHGARFDLKSGAVKAPPAIVPIDTYKIKIDGDTIFVYLTD